VGRPASTPFIRTFLTVAASGFLDAMNTTIRHRAHRGVAVAVLAGTLIGCASEELAYWSPGNDFQMTIQPLD
jgi:hypothetical protein